MTCGEVREILFAFLDNELDAALSIDVQRHMEHCPDCAREAETERTIQKRLSAIIEHDAALLPALEESLYAVVSVPAVIRRRRRLGVRTWLLVSTGIAALVLLGVFVQRYIRSSGIMNRQGGLVDLLIADFDHFLSEGRPVQIASADRSEVSQWLHGKTGFAVSLPATKGHCKLIGARKCNLNGQPAALASYEMDTNPACLVVLAGGSDALSNMKRISREGQTFWVNRYKDHAVVACQRDELIYAAVSRTHEDELLHFLSELE